MSHHIRDQLFRRINFEQQAGSNATRPRFGLDTMRRLMQVLGRPELSTPVVHVAGTKGKGSTCMMIAEILRQAGYRVGLYTSPHLERLEERYWINGDLLSPESLDKHLRTVLQAADEIDTELAADCDKPVENDKHAEEGQPAKKVEIAGAASDTADILTSPTFFEITTAVAFLAFREAKTDIVVLETGMGGRLDSTNVCQPAVTAITNVGFDHMQFLGDTLEKIAGEKGGIIKPGIPIVSGVSQLGARQIIRELATTRSAMLLELEADFGTRDEDLATRPECLTNQADSNRADTCAAQPSPTGMDSSNTGSPDAGKDNTVRDNTAKDTTKDTASKHSTSKHSTTKPTASNADADRTDTCEEGPGHFAPRTASPFSAWVRRPGLGKLAEYRQLTLKMLGRHQRDNAAIAIAVCDLLREGGWQLTEEHIRNGLGSSQFPARIEFDSQVSDLVFDVAHNEPSLRALVETLDDLCPDQPRCLVFAVSYDKDRAPMLRLIAENFDRVVVSQFRENPRATSPEVLQAELLQLLEQRSCRLSPSRVQLATTPLEAMQTSFRERRPDELICVAGSIFFVAEVQRVLQELDRVPLVS